MKIRTVAVAGTAALALALAACGGSGSGSGSGSSGSDSNVTLSIANTSGSTWTCGFNPFNPSVNGTSFGFVYEPLVYVNPLKNAAETPMLATKSEWSSDAKTLTFTIRQGVKWSDGQPFSAKDVAFTFNLLKKFSGLDLNALWSSGLKSVTAGTDTVTLKFDTAAKPYYYYVADQTPIVPEHIWGTGDVAKNPVTYADSNPVATGPYTIGNCKPQNIQYSANKNFWQPGLPKIKTVNYPAYTDNSPANLDLATGKAQWGGQFIPNIDRYYVARDKTNHHYWFPPTTNVSLYPNLKHSVTGNKTVRQALAFAIDRAQVAKVGEGGYQPAANQSGIVLPTYQDWYNQQAADQYGYTFNQDKAKQLLSQAGYSASKPLKLTVITVSGYTDWDASLQEIKQELAQVNIDLTVQDLAGPTYNTRIYKGDFDLAYASQTGGPTPYYELRQMLYSGNTAPLGQNATSNYERFSDPDVDALFKSYASADEGQQQEIVKEIQKSMLSEVPVIPVTEGVSWFQYSTKDITGWPTAQDPYALPAPYALPDVEQVLLRLSPK
ncbi:peptide/nickel transport system substrate-binding protein [Friedmanniella endophytica]|uniref:Peptide/nickel transport system substrate-binding protein n=1 Tax=Microlunatus kandeliicorticis TaxID=1759536 RepID=A0A7W3IQV9_9ACTN|nr:ABC transporter substrate-binding protein [Microlunatus kandeliicorticis]MBA8793553.1 peptide/nickel transport system substrate-binding protein [Microlunatus kandeliicorticis]